MWDGQRVTVMVPSKDDPYFAPPKDDPPVAFEGNADVLVQFLQISIDSIFQGS